MTIKILIISNIVNSEKVATWLCYIWANAKSVVVNIHRPRPSNHPCPLPRNPSQPKHWVIVTHWFRIALVNERQISPNIDISSLSQQQTHAFSVNWKYLKWTLCCCSCLCFVFFVFCFTLIVLCHFIPSARAYITFRDLSIASSLVIGFCFWYLS